MTDKGLRKLKYPKQRLPENRVGLMDIKRIVSEETGYPASKIGVIMDTIMDTIKKSILDKKLVDLMGLVKLYLEPAPERTATNFKNKKNAQGQIHGYPGQKVERMKTPATWRFRARASRSFYGEGKLLAPPTKKELDKLYRD